MDMAKLKDQVICRICLDPNQIGKSHINRSIKILLTDSFELIVPVTCAWLVSDMPMQKLAHKCVTLVLA